VDATATLPIEMRRDGPGGTQTVRRVASEDLAEREIAALRRLLRAAFRAKGSTFTEDDWAHALGGIHLLLELDGEIVAHAAVVERELHVDERPVRTGYVEAVATRPNLQARGFGTRVMAEAGRHIVEHFELGALSTGTPGFYQRLGWQPWDGPTFVRTAAGRERTADDDDGILVLLTPFSPPIARSESLSCEWRPGDVW
jgi:aminoglycoside 2'-N-acetyltransferase I